jgi:hypothetical protein
MNLYSFLFGCIFAYNIDPQPPVSRQLLLESRLDLSVPLQRNDSLEAKI